nr:F-box/FBD/LRR-repeat protein At1g13570 isoform X3 [Oryza sativa Japonica Group]XP_015617760.1 F-box/FBD/LRR-repeat protein At1g13570 isoform X3 [Oryza sativa Japonica Group]
MAAAIPAHRLIASSHRLFASSRRQLTRLLPRAARSPTPGPGHRRTPLPRWTPPHYPDCAMEEEEPSNNRRRRLRPISEATQIGKKIKEGIDRILGRLKSTNFVSIACCCCNTVFINFQLTADQCFFGLMAKRMNPCHGKLVPKNKRAILQFDDIPEDVVFLIIRLLSLTNAARVSMVSQKWLQSWRLYPNLEFTSKALGLNKRVHKQGRRAKFVRCVNTIIRHHAGTGINSFTLKRNLNNHKYAHYIDRWIYFAVRSGANELTIDLSPRWYAHPRDVKYSFPSSNVAAPEPTSIEHLKLCFMNLRPLPTFSGLRSLKTLDLALVCITTEDLESLLSYTPALQQLKLRQCPMLEYLKITDVLAKLVYIDIVPCLWLKILEIHAQNLVAINTYNICHLKIVLSEALVLKGAHIELVLSSDVIEYAFTDLAPLMPDLESLFLSGCTEMIISRRPPSNRFHCLKQLELKLQDISTKYDLLFLAKFVDAAPVLEALVFHLEDIEEPFCYMEKEAELRSLEKHCPHKNLKLVKMTGFSAGRSSLELALYFVENSPALELLILDHRLDRSVCRITFGGDLDAKCSKGYEHTISKYVSNAIPRRVRLSYS